MAAQYMYGYDRNTPAKSNTVTIPLTIKLTIDK